MDGSIDNPLGPRPNDSSGDLGPRPQEAIGIGYQGQSEDENAAFTRFGNGVGHVLSAMTGAAGDALSEDQFSGPVLEELRKAKVIGDQAKITGQFNETVLRPLIMAGEWGARFMGAGFAAYQAGVSKAGEELGAPQIGNELAAMPEAFMGHAESFHYISKARELDIIGDRADKSAPYITPGEAPPLPILDKTLPLEPDTVTKPLDVYGLARQIAPETFQVFDPLQQRQELLRENIDLLDQYRKEAASSLPEAKTLQDTINSTLAKVNGIEDRLTKKQANILNDARAKLDEIINPTSDSPEMKEVRDQLQKNDFQMRGMAEKVSKAYEEARAQIPEILPEPAKLVASETVQSEAPKEILSSQGQLISSPEMLNNIVETEKQKLISAGRPENEANLAAQLVALHYETFAKYFDGTKGTAEELYKSEAPPIEGPQQKTKIPETQITKVSQEVPQNIVEMKPRYGAGQNGNYALEFNNPIDKALYIAGSRVNKGGGGLRNEMTLELTGPAKVAENWLVSKGFTRSEIYEGSKQVKEALKPLAHDAARTIDHPGVLSVPEIVKEKVQNAGKKLTIEDINANDLNQTTQGRLRTFADNKTIIKLFKSADASTFIHETGHKWLSELMDAAKDEQAPQQLRDLASASRQWLGVADDFNMADLKNKIVRAAHEKWARAFERYLYDGQAPTPALTQVFTQFREWLQQIYSKFKGLTPISDDIKDVFDRLITPNPERQPVGKIEPVGKTLADIHEADAKLTPPRQADAVGNIVSDEIHSMVKGHSNLEEAVNGRTIEPGFEGSPSTGNGNEAAKPGPEHVDTGREGIITTSSEVGGGAGAVEREGKAGEGGAGPGIKLTDAGEKAETKGATDAKGNFTKNNSVYLNKAGNIRQDTLNVPDDIFKAAKDAAQANGDFMVARRGKLSLAEQKMIADDLGVQVLDTWKVGDAFNSSEILYVRQAFIDAATVVRDSMAIAAESGLPADIATFAKARARLIMVQEVLSGITAEAGRALAAFRNIEGFRTAKALSDFLRDTQGMDLFQMQEMSERGKGLKDVHQMSTFLQSSLKPDFSERMIYYYVNSLISGPLTHLRYGIGNAINAIVRPVFIIPIAATQGAIKEAIGLKMEDRVYFGEAGAQLHAMFKGAQDGIRAGAEAFRTNQSPLLPGERVPSKGANFGNNPIIQNWAYEKAVKEGLEGQALQARITELVRNPDNTAPEVAFGQAMSVPGRSVAAIHSFFKSLRYEQNIAGLAYRMATNEKLVGANFDRRVAELTERPTVEMMAKVTKDNPEQLPEGLRANINDATQDALKELYMRNTEYGTAIYHLAAAVNMTPAAKVIVPFLKIGTEIIDNAIQHSPLEIARTAYSKEARSSLYGAGANSDIARAKVIFGTSLMGATSLMVLQGLATGDGPTDPRERDTWLKLHKPNSITIGNLSIPYQGLGHLGMLMRFSANLTETSQGWDEKEGSIIASEYFQDITRSILDESWMRGAHDMMEAMYDEKGPKAARFIRSFATNWLPYSVGLGQVARAIDPYQRKVDDLGSENLWGIFAAAEAKMPLLSQRLMSKRDSYGEPLHTGYNQYQNDPTTLMLDKLQTGIGYLPREIAGVKLNEDQYDDYQRIAGRYTKIMLDNLSSNQVFLNAKPEIQLDAISKIISKTRKGAQNAIFAQHPEILKQAVDNAQHDVEN